MRASESNGFTRKGYDGLLVEPAPRLETNDVRKHDKRDRTGPAHLGQARPAIRQGHQILREDTVFRRAGVGLLAGKRSRPRDWGWNRPELRTLSAGDPTAGHRRERPD